VEHLRILVVDDHEVVRSLLRHLLETEHGWEVCGEAADGDEAVQRSRALHPDVIVMDAVMPGCNGFEATREIIRTTPEIGIVITTLYEYPPGAEGRGTRLYRQIKNDAAAYPRRKERPRSSAVFPASFVSDCPSVLSDYPPLSQANNRYTALTARLNLLPYS
jgi:CheY-like chemotaxis protein